MIEYRLYLIRKHESHNGVYSFKTEANAASEGKEVIDEEAPSERREVSEAIEGFLRHLSEQLLREVQTEDPVVVQCPVYVPSGGTTIVAVHSEHILNDSCECARDHVREGLAGRAEELAKID